MLKQREINAKGGKAATMNYIGLFMIVQMLFAVIIGLYFWNLLKNQQSSKTFVLKEAKKEMDKLRAMKAISLTEPLAEKTRPTKLTEIVGQEEGIKGLRAALCGPNPQHVIIYGPPGVGKTAAARIILEEAKKNACSPFKETAKFVEIDATTARFDERGIADPLLGSVHDPIYQGAGQLGMAGIPQPKPGAVSKAHGGILFIDEIGELHPIQMNKLLKVLEDRRVMFESAYYNSEDPKIPEHIHEIFQNGLPADFRLIGATTRQPQDIPPAIRSRCVEVFFRQLMPDEIAKIARQAIQRIGFTIDELALERIKRFATNGREVVNMVQLAAGLGMNENRTQITLEDIEWVINSGQYSPRLEKTIPSKPQIGYVNGLAVTGPNQGMLIEIEASAVKVKKGRGKLTVTGVIDEEEIGTNSKKMRRKSMVMGSAENVITVLRQFLDVNPNDYNIHINFPGGVPIDGPSAGVTMATAIYSAIKGIPVDNKVAMTGELSIRGLVKPVGGVPAKIEAARLAGAKKVFIPFENWQAIFRDTDGVEVIPVSRLEEIFDGALVNEQSENKCDTLTSQVNVLSASNVSLN